MPAGMSGKDGRVQGRAYPNGYDGGDRTDTAGARAVATPAGTAMGVGARVVAKVETSRAAPGTGAVRLVADATCVLLCLLNGVQVYHLVGRLNGGGDNVGPARPLAEINQAAALAAKRELLILAQNNRLTGRTTYTARAFLHGPRR